MNTRIKKLPAGTACTLFEINAPMWNGAEKKRVVGLNKSRITKHNEIKFTYRRKSDGQLSIPGSFYFDGDLVGSRGFNIMNVKGVSLLLVPLSELDELVRSKR